MPLKTVRRYEVRARLTEGEYHAAMQLVRESGLSQADLLRRIIMASAKRKFERVAGGEIEHMASDIELASKRVEALHGRLGGVENTLLGALQATSNELATFRNAILDVGAAVRTHAVKTLDALATNQQDIRAAISELIRLETLTALRLQAVMDIQGTDAVKNHFLKLVAQAREQGAPI